MTETRRVPRSAWILGLLLSFALAGLVVVAFLVVNPSTSTGFVVPLVLTASLAFAFALAWPAGYWRWGIAASAGFWVFFLAVFLAYVSVGEWDLLSAVRAASSLLAGVAGAMVAGRIRPPGRTDGRTGA